MSQKRVIMYISDETQYMQLRIILLKQGIKVSEWLRQQVAQYITSNNKML